jgi:hypothetical protein
MNKQEKTEEKMTSIKAQGHTSIRGFLYSVASEGLGQEEWVIREAEQQRGLFHDLEDRIFDGWRVGVGQRIKVEGDYGNPI